MWLSVFGCLLYFNLNKDFFIIRTIPPSTISNFVYNMATKQPIIQSQYYSVFGR